MGNGLKPFKEKPPSFAYQPLINPPISVEAENESLRVFSFKELKKAMKKFRQDRVVIGDDGSVRTFYKGYVNETTFAPSRTVTGIAVYVVECPKDSSQALQEWMEEVKSLGKISHPNLVKTLGYSCEDNKSLFFVFEYLHKGSLDHYIFGKEEEVLPWETRVKIATGTAQGLAFIHSVKNSSLHREIRMDNIMLDEQYNAKLFYLESNQQCLEEEFCQVVGEFGYFAPECAVTVHFRTEADVYTFGVILLELLTGLKAFDRERNKDKENLAVWTKSFLSDKIGEIIDPRLGNDYPVNAATRMGTLIKRCIEENRMKRPLMQQVLDGLNDIAEIKD